MFDTIIAKIYSRDKSIYKYLDVTADAVAIYRDTKKLGEPLFSFKFANEEPAVRPDRGKPADENKPLAGIKILLDPGHIGGRYSKMEERHFQWKNEPPLKEGTINLEVAKIVQAGLQKYGASTLLTKRSVTPVTRKDPLDFIGRETEFYRKHEIRARAKIAQIFKADLNICIHVNAGPKDTPGEPWTRDNRLVVFVHGSYGADEIAIERQRFELFRKLLEQSHDFELRAAMILSESLRKATDLLPVDYAPSPYHFRVNENLFVYARNLAANRIFAGPTVYLEPYYINNVTVYKRLQIGDYDGLLEIDGESHKSIYREYADAIIEGTLKVFNSEANQE